MRPTSIMRERKGQWRCLNHDEQDVTWSTIDEATKVVPTCEVCGAKGEPR